MAPIAIADPGAGDTDRPWSRGHGPTLEPGTRTDPLEPGTRTGRRLRTTLTKRGETRPVLAARVKPVGARCFDQSWEVAEVTSEAVLSALERSARSLGDSVVHTAHSTPDSAAVTLLAMNEL